MKQLLLISILLCFSSFLWSQSTERISVQGIIFSKENDVESITVYNLSSNKGTITNTQGEFTIAVALHDKIEVSALQFKTVLVVVDADVIASKQLKIQLIEQVNQLDAVLLSNGLSGNVNVDISNVKVIKPILIDMGNMNVAFEYNDDKAFDNNVLENDLNRIMNSGQFYGGINLGMIFDMLSLFKRNKSKNRIESFNVRESPKNVLDIYSTAYLSETFNIPDNKIEAFLNFIEKDVNEELLKQENEMQLMELLLVQRNLFSKEE